MIKSSSYAVYPWLVNARLRLGCSQRPELKLEVTGTVCVHMYSVWAGINIGGRERDQHNCQTVPR